MPIVSVIIPTYNAEKTIQETVSSVLNQTLSDLELIIINDGSTDRTLDVVSTLDDPRLKVFSYPNAGVAISRNRGLSKATGQYISFIDADDLWTPDKLEAQYQALQDNPQASVAYSWTDYVDESGQFLGVCARATNSGNLYQLLLLADVIGSGSNPLIKAEAIAKVGEFDPAVVPTEDWDMWIRLAEHFQYVAVPAVHILYRQLPNSGSYNMRKMEVSSLRVLEKVFEKNSESINAIKSAILGNRYKCFAWKALEGIPERHRAWTGGRFLWHSIQQDKSLLKKKVTWKIFIKIAILSILPRSIASDILTRKKRLSHIDALLYSLQYPIQNTEN
ncbi:MAG: glycosyltransferase [Cyanobacteria bacterium J055]|nr:MAG: glycosyltransferase [Cyanobacteria bacterium J055]